MIFNVIGFFSFLHIYHRGILVIQYIFYTILSLADNYGIPIFCHVYLTITINTNEVLLTTD